MMNGLKTNKHELLTNRVMSTENKLMVTNESGVRKMREKNERDLVQIASCKNSLGDVKNSTA